jgi:hypothetical protein
MERDQRLQKAETLDVCNQNYELKERISELETEVLELKSKKTSGLSYLVKRAEAGSSGDFEIHESRPVKIMGVTDSLSQRINALAMKKNPK